MKWIFLIVIMAGIGFGGMSLLRELSSGNGKLMVYPRPEANFWAFRSIDTMKHSRDLAREKLSDASYDAVINREVRAIAETGASHVAIATPYDEEFVPYLSRWVSAARRNHIKVWFRGNFSGWEEWFGYPRISREEHLRKTREFILKNASLFEEGDAFSSCPECENGGPGDPRQTGDVSGYRDFLIAEYETANATFEKLGKRVTANYFSMNGDVARLVMDRATTRKLGGVVTVDHYVKTPENLETDARGFISESGGALVFGEFGAPIPDIQGKMTEEAQAMWIEETLLRLSRLPDVFGVNYWAHVGSSTALWDERGIARKGVEILSRYYRPRVFYGVVSDELGAPIAEARLSVGDDHVVTKGDGYFELREPLGQGTTATISVAASGFLPHEVDGEVSQMSIVLEREYESRWFKFKKWLKGKINGK